MTKRFELSSPYSKFNWNTKEDHAGNPCAKGEPSTIPYPRYRLKYGVFSAYTTVNTRSKGFILNYRQWDQWSILWIAASLLLKRKVHLLKALPKALALSFYYHGREIHRKQQVKSNCSQQHFCKQWAPSLKGRKFNSNRTAGCTQWGWGRARGYSWRHHPPNSVARSAATKCNGYSSKRGVTCHPQVTVQLWVAVSTYAMFFRLHWFLKLKLSHYSTFMCIPDKKRKLEHQTSLP